MTRVEMAEWTRTGKHPEYPESAYLLGFGVDRTRAGAEAKAVARLEEAIVQHALGMAGGGLQGTQFGKLVTGRANWFSLGEFGDSVRTDGMGDGFESVAMRAIARDDLALYARGMLEEARKDMQAAPAGSAGGFRRRVEDSARAFVSAARVVALRLLADGSIERGALERAENAGLGLQELVHLMRIEQTGAGQAARMLGGLDQPLGLKAWFRTELLNGLPLAWGTALGLHAVLDGDVQTGELGQAACRVLQLSPSGQEFGFVQCAIDLDRMTPRRTGIALSPWLWKTTLPCRHNTELVIKVTENIDGKAEGFEKSFVPGLTEWCKGRSLSSAIEKPSTREFTYRLLLEGEIRVQSWVERDIPMARTSGKVTLRDAGDNRLLYDWTPGLLREGPAGNSAEGQAILTLREAAAEGLVEFCTRLITVAPAPNEEFSGR